MDEKLLSPFGLAPNELAVFKALLDAGGLSPAALARAVKIKRTTAYSVARGLVEKGIAMEDITRRPRIFQVASPEHILSLIDDERKRSQERERTLKRLADELSKQSARTSYPVPTVRFIEEEKIHAFLRQQSPVWNKNLGVHDGIWWGFQDHTFVEHFAEWIGWYWEHVSPDVVVQLLSNRAPVEVAFGKQHALRDKRRIKYWGEANNFLSTTWVIGDYVVMINTRARPFYLVEIHDTLMAHDQREVFKNLWGMVG